MRSMRDLLLECRRRRVFRVAALYVLGAWATLQVADLAFASWNVPASALRYVWLGATLGLPIALVLGWRFDVVGGRVIRETADGDKTDLTLQRTDYLLLALVGAVVVVTVYGLASEISIVRDTAATPPVSARIDPRSIAVLPLQSTGPDAESADFLALGIQDDLLTRLSAVGSLKVISRTSVERYRDTSLSLRQIGAELGVSKIVEGRVQRDGSKVHVNVQLIDALTDEHVWAASYNRDLTTDNVFSVQTQIAGTIARELHASLTPRESGRLKIMPTRSMPAYTSYLKGQQQANLVSIESLNRAIDYFEEAIELDPEFVLAYVGLADAYLALGSNFYGGLSVEEAIALAEPPLALALSLDSESGEAHASIASMYLMQGGMADAEEAVARAVEMAPNYSYAYRVYGRLRWWQGKRDEALAFAQKALELNPYYAPANFDVARYHDIMGDFDEALTRYLRVVEVQSDYAFAYVYIGAIYYLVHGRPDESLVWYHRAAKSDALSPSLKASPAIAYLELGDIAAARPWVALGLAQGPDTFWPRWTSVLLNLAGGDDKAAAADARQLLESSPRFSFALRILRDFDLQAGRIEVARSRYARAHPELLGGELPAVDHYNYRSAVDLALVLQLSGDASRAEDLLEQSLVVVRQLPRLGTDGYWIDDARIYALQGRPDLALSALRTAKEEGWRILTWYFLDRDPTLESLRDRPEFRAIRDEIRADLSAQAENMLALRASGELTSY